MRKRDVEKLLLRCAEASWHTEFVIIGSQAIPQHARRPRHRSRRDVTRPRHVPESRLQQPEHRLRIDDARSRARLLVSRRNRHVCRSGQHDARALPDWLGRPHHPRIIGTVEVADGQKREVTVIYPEIHDLTVAKLAIGRQKDIEFLEGVIDLKLVNKDVLKERYRQASHPEPRRLVEGLAQIDKAFDRGGATGGADGATPGS